MVDSPSPIELARRALTLAEAATAGPWEARVLHADGVIIRRGGRFEIFTPEFDVCASLESSAPIRREEDAAFIAFCRTALPTLARAVIEAEKVTGLYHALLEETGRAVPAPEPPHA